MPLLQTLLDPGRELLLANLDSMCAGLKECSRAAGLLQAKAKVIHSLYHASNARLGNDIKRLGDENAQLKREVTKLGDERRQVLGQIDTLLKDIGKLDLE